jgi:hypothetical protein
MASEVLFGIGGNDAAALISGWSGDEPGIRWTIGHTSSFVMTTDCVGNCFVLELECNPFAGDAGLPSAQRIILTVNGEYVACATLTHGTISAFMFRGLDRSRKVFEFTLALPDAARPSDLIVSSDDRMVSLAMLRARLFSVDPPVPAASSVSCRMLPGRTPFDQFVAETERLSGFSITDLVGHFESLGHDCEFGLFQRMCGAEPIGMFRFAEIDVRNLISGLDAGFEALEDPEFISAVTYHPDGDFHIHHSKYHFRYHTYSYPKDITAEAVEARHSKLLLLNRRLLLERITNAERIFVFKRNRPLSDAEALALFLALRRQGPATLLYIVPADQNHPSGCVEIVFQGLMKGYLGTFWRGDEASIEVRHWLEICLNASALASWMAPSDK